MSKQEAVFADMEAVTRMIADYQKIVQTLTESEVSCSQMDDKLIYGRFRWEESGFFYPESI